MSDYIKDLDAELKKHEPFFRIEENRVVLRVLGRAKEEIERLTAANKKLKGVNKGLSVKVKKLEAELDLEKDANSIRRNQPTHHDDVPGVFEHSGEPDAWRITDGEGDFSYRTELPEDESIAWSARYGRKWQPLYTVPSTAVSELIKEIDGVVIDWGDGNKLVDYPDLAAVLDRYRTKP